MKKNNSNIKEMKKIVYQTINEELQKNHLECKIFPVTILEFYKKILSSKEYSLFEKAFCASNPFNFSGVYQSQEITIFLNQFSKMKDFDMRLFRLLFVCYHELRHLYQDYLFSTYTLEGYLRYIEYKNQEFNFGDDYNKNHDKYSYEIGANLYGIHKAEEYFRKEYPDQFEKIKDTCQELEKKFMIDYFSYDPMDTINRYVLMMQLRYKEAHFILSQNKDFALPDEVTSIFLRDDYTCKNLIEVLQHPKFASIEKKLIYSFVTSNVFLESISFEQLGDKEKEFLKEAINYTSTFYQNQSNTLSHYGVMHFSENKSFGDFWKNVDNLITGKENTFRNESNQRKHLKNILVLERKLK